MPDRSVGTRTIALVGPGGAGKTSLAEALLFAAGAVDRQGSVDAGTSAGGSTPARPRARVGRGGAGKPRPAAPRLVAAGAVDRQGSVDAGTSVGDSSPEARARRGSTELNLPHLEFLGDRFALIDAPGSVGFAADASLAVSAADLAV